MTNGDGTPADRASSLVRLVQSIVGTLRDRRNHPESTLALVTVGCWSIAVFAWESASKFGAMQHLAEKVAAGFVVISVLPLARLLWRLWALSSTTESPTRPVQPSAIKGLSSFGPQDGDLFLRLERTEELRTLVGHVKDDRTPLLVVVGESGSGKTSLVHSGLQYALDRDHQIPCIYWEARPREPELALLRTISKSGIFQPSPTQLQDVLQSTTSKTRLAIILDQFEQLEPDNPDHQPVFNLLKQAYYESPPHQIIWIVTYRRDFDTQWRNFEENTKINPPFVSVKTFSIEQAQRVMTTIGTEARLFYESGLLEKFVSGVAEDGRVSPTDIGMGSLVLAGTARQRDKTHLSADEFELVGAVPGMYAAFIQERLARYNSNDQKTILRALLSLVDLSRDQRLTEGRTVEEMASEANYSSGRLEAIALELSSENARILESVAVQERVKAPRYRLTHERLISPLKFLAGMSLVGKERARVTFATGYRSWIETGRRRYLLGGADLRIVLKNRDVLFGGRPPLAKHLEYISASKRHRLNRQILWTIFAAGLVLGSWDLFRWIRAERVHDSLADWQLPDNLCNYMPQVKTLSLSVPLTDIEWLSRCGGRSSLDSLSLYRPAIKNINGLSRLLALKSLTVAQDPSLTNFTGLINLPQLELLDLSSTGIESLEQLPNLVHLKSLNGSNNSSLKSVAGADKLSGLESLDLSYTGITRLEPLRDLTHLKELNLSGDYFLVSLTGLDKLPQLHSLDVSDSRINSLDELQNLFHLKSLKLTGDSSMRTLAGAEKLTELESLSVHRAGITNLEILQNLPHLRILDLSYVTSLKDFAVLEKLPQLESLNLSNSGTSRLEKLPNLPHLKRLDLSYNSSLKDVAELGKFTQLEWVDLSYTGVSSLKGLQNLRHLKTLKLAGCSLAGLIGIDRLIELESLDLSSTGISNLEDLRNLTQLKVLDVSYPSAIKDFAGLENLPQLESLNLSHSGFTKLERLRNLAGLKSLNLSRNFALGNLIGLDNLKELESVDLSYTGIRSLDRLQSLNHLKMVKLSGDSLLVGLLGLDKATELESVDLSDTGIRSVEELQNLRLLKSIQLRGLRDIRGLPASVEQVSF